MCACDFSSTNRVQRTPSRNNCRIEITRCAVSTRDPVDGKMCRGRSKFAALKSSERIEIQVNWNVKLLADWLPGGQIVAVQGSLRRGVQRLAAIEAPAHDTTFLEALGRAFYLLHLLDSGAMASGSAIARAEGLHQSTVNELLRLSLLAPDLIERLLAGRQPRRLTLMWFQRHQPPVEWLAQRELIASFE